MPPDPHIQVRAERVANGFDRPQPRRNEGPELQTRDNGPGDSRRCREVRLPPASTYPQSAYRPTDAEGVHVRDRGRLRSPVAYAIASWNEGWCGRRAGPGVGRRPAEWRESGRPSGGPAQVWEAGRPSGGPARVRAGPRANTLQRSVAASVAPHSRARSSSPSPSGP